MPVRNNNIQINARDGISNPAIRRLARRGGVKRINGDIYEKVRSYLIDKDGFLSRVIKDTVTYTEHRRGKTVTAMDVLQALKHGGRTMYGFGDQNFTLTAGKRKRPPNKSDARLRADRQEAMRIMQNILEL